MGINLSAVQKYVEVLKEKKYIERIGDTRGYWKVNLPK
jgi:ATP-dependent DNA helicase RecG